MSFNRILRRLLLAIPFLWNASLKAIQAEGNENSYKGQCHCGSIHFEAKGEPLFTQYCHCNKCRAVADNSKNLADKKGYNFTAAYQTKNFKIMEGEDKLTSMISNGSRLYLCSVCKSLIYGISEDPEKQGGIGINANNFQFTEGIRPDSFGAVRHIWYPNRIVDFDDKLPKFKDAPKEQFGTGELVQ